MKEYVKIYSISLFLLLHVTMFCVCTYAYDGTSPADTTELNYGDDLSASFHFQDEVDYYSFTGTNGDKVIIRLGALSPYFYGGLELQAPDGATVALDISTGGVARIDHLLLQNGTYFILVKEANENFIGNYGLSLEKINPASNALSLECISDIMASIDIAAEMDAYTFDALAGDQVIFQTNGTSPSYSSRMELYAPNGDLVELEISNGTLARIEAIQLIQNGSYTLVIMEGGGDASGNYGLSLQFLHAACSQFIECDTDISASIDGIAEMDAYTFDGTAGEHIIIQINGLSSFFDARMELYAPDHSLVELEISNGNLARIGAIQLPQSGYYTLVVMEDGGDFIGSYGLSLQTLLPNCTQLITCDEPISAVFNYPAQINGYTFEGVAGSNISLSMSELSSTLIPRLEIYAPDFSLLELEIDSNMVALNLDLTESGDYFILALDQEGINTGSYLIHLNECILDVMEEISKPLFSLRNYPNPFREFVIIEFKLPLLGYVRLGIFDTFGTEVITLLNEKYQPGQYRVKWMPMDLTSGIYWCILQVDTITVSQVLALFP